MMSPPKCIAIIKGTSDVHLPLYRFLYSCLEEPIFLIACPLRGADLCAHVESLTKEYEVWIIPSNERTLNASTKDQFATHPRIRYLSSASDSTGQFISPAQLSDKAFLSTILNNETFDSFIVASTKTLITEADYENLSPQDFPAILKPASKDGADSFTKSIPSKVIYVESLSDLYFLRQKYLSLFQSTRLILQEYIPGSDISWFGTIQEKSVHGFAIQSLVKSPTSQVGGTSTLVRSFQTPPKIQNAVEAMAEAWKLEGVFEIEFIQQKDALFFFHELNPRPILQTTLLLSQAAPSFLSFLSSKGFTPTKEFSIPLASSPYWSSTWRYMSLNAGWPLSWSTFLRTLRHDVRFSSFYSHRERLQYCIQLFSFFGRWVRSRIQR